ncbi:MAG: histidine--tRNA ligase [Bdellovibrionales bacterium]|nr:histidine--tRNA ligase [Bdellovibrionales bacterium]
MNKKLSTGPYKGTRDFYPADKAIQSYIFDVMAEVAELYGYEEYDGPILESTEIYRIKSGDEIVNQQTYTFEDRGGREVTIRPEMTPTVARMVAAKRRELAFPLRWYSIPNLYRYEKPQRGRLREHWQLNADIFGVNSVDADIEIIQLANSIMQAFGAEEKNYEIRVNNRKLVNHFLYSVLNLSKENGNELSKLIDRKDKMKPEAFQENLNSILPNYQEVFLNFINSKNIDELTIELQNSDGAKELNEVLTKLKSLGVNSAKFHPSLMRGFDYYTGGVFEVFDLHPENNRSLFGGGRYDNLVGDFGVDAVSGAGFGMGDVTIKDFLETYKLLPEIPSSTSIYICPLATEFFFECTKLATELREHGINVAVDYSGKKVGAQIKTASSQKIPHVICIGEEEIKSRKIKIKDLETREETELELDGLAEALLSTEYE